MADGNAGTPEKTPQEKFDALPDAQQKANFDQAAAHIADLVAAAVIASGAVTDAKDEKKEVKADLATKAKDAKGEVKKAYDATMGNLSDDNLREIFRYRVDEAVKGQNIGKEAWEKAGAKDASGFLDSIVGAKKDLKNNLILGGIGVAGLGVLAASMKGKGELNPQTGEIQKKKGLSFGKVLGVTVGLVTTVAAIAAMTRQNAKDTDGIGHKLLAGLNPKGLPGISR